jgi:hypothetical protein
MSMGRKEGGSLFHQFISTPDLFMLQNRTDKDGNPLQVSFQTRKSYMDVLHYAAAYFKSEGIRRKSDITKADVQDYERHLEEKGCSASTIHSYLSPLCKATGVAMKDIQKPTRQASEFKRGSKSRKSDGGRPGEGRLSSKCNTKKYFGRRSPIQTFSRAIVYGLDNSLQNSIINRMKVEPFWKEKS